MGINVLKLLVVVAVVPSILTISSISIVGITTSYSQTDGRQSGSSSPNQIYITKDGSNSYILSSGSSQIGSFDTTYTIVGNVDSINESKDLIKSTITEDYDNSPVVGYVLVGANESDSPLPTLANPFADTTMINEKIKSEIQSSIDMSQKLETSQAEIKCNFGMEINDWNCITHSLLG